jgi:hypothetical protein
MAFSGLVLGDGIKPLQNVIVTTTKNMGSIVLMMIFTFPFYVESEASQLWLNPPFHRETGYGRL